MRFAHPMILWLLLLVPAIAGVLLWQHQRRNRRLAEIGDVDRISALFEDLHPTLPALRYVLVLFGLALTIVAAARPQLGTAAKLTKQAGIDIAVAIDVSRSMTARDIKPDRLRRAKLELLDLIDRLRGDRLGLVVFAGDSFVQCPLTTDYAALRLFLNSVEIGLVPRAGTNMESAIRRGSKMLLDAHRGAPRGKVLVLLTDGENQEGDAVEAAKEAAKNEVIVYTVGIGSSTGEPIPEVDAKGNVRGYKKDRRGETVMSRLDEALLRQIADAGKGRYIHSASGGVGIAEVHQELARLQKAEFEARLFVQFDEKYQWVLWPALFFLLLGTLLGERRRVTSAA